MKITHIITSLATGGAETGLVNLAQQTLEDGHELRIIVLNKSDGVPNDRAHELGLAIDSLPKGLAMLRSLAGIRSNLSQADAVHVHLFPSLYIVALIRPRTRLIYTEHSTTNRRRDKPLFWPLDRWAYSRYDEITAVSDGAAESLGRHLRRIGSPRRISVVRNGIPDSFFSETPERATNGPLALLAVGRLDWRKNFGDAIRAISFIENASLTIVGDGPQRGELQQLTLELGLETRVRFTGVSSDVATLMRNHQLLLITSLHEGFSLVAAEAMATGLPVVGPAIPGLAQTVLDGKTGLLYPEGSTPEVIASTVESLVKDSNLYLQFSRAARAHAQGFSIDSTAREYIRVYEELGAKS
jgi:glycosyltransferase involved in cell wall biosynthesis